MDIKDFAREFLENVSAEAEMNNNDYDHVLAESIIDYLVDNGEVNAPEICVFQKTRARITAYDYNDEAESLDLFYLIKAECLLGKINNSKLQQGFNYLSSFYRGAMNENLLKSVDVDRNDEIVEVARLVQSTKGKINQLRLYVITDGQSDPTGVPEPVESEDGDFTIEYNVWDMHRIFQQNNIRAGKEKVEIDFPTDYNTELQCLKMSDENPFVDAYMAIIPGSTLARIYKRYQQVLLEKNVRTFLQFKGKVNKGIRKTLRDEPDMFFSYNNGISTTASEIEVREEEGTFYITRLIDWQIVNGGQTTASIAASLSDREVELSKVFVPMKVSVIRDADNSEDIIKAISTSANSQTAIKNSDFSANDPFLVDLENKSRTEWVPNGNNRPICKWYFERTRGQYLDQLAQLRGLNEKAFKQEYPKSQKISKTEIAKFVATWKMRPFDVCRGLEANYALFVADVKREKPVVTQGYFHRLVSIGILLSTIDKIVKSKKLGGYKAAMVAYIGASLSFLSDGNLDFDYIWKNQRVQQEVVDKIEELIPITWMHLTQSSYPNVLTWTKKPECWNRLKLKLNDFDKFGKELLQDEVNEDGSRLNEAQQNRIREADEIEPNTWFALASWAKARNLLTPLDRKAAFNFGTMRSRGQGMKSVKQAQNALKIYNKAQELGFEG